MMLSSVNFLRRAIRKARNIPEPLPHCVQIEVTNVCNLSCRMCVRNFIKLDRSHMDFGMFKKIVDRLNGVKRLILTGYGEPLLHPHIIEAIAYCKERHFEVHITSNGLALKDEKLLKAVVSSGLDSLAISIEDLSGETVFGHDNHETTGVLERLVDYKKHLGILLPEITLQTLLIKGKEGQLYDLIKWAAHHGARRINVARFDLNTLTDVNRSDRQEEKRIFIEFARLRLCYKIQIDCVQDQCYDGFRSMLYKNFKYFLGMDKNCIRLQEFMYIGVNGIVRPCCALVDHPIGSILDQRLIDIWTSEQYQRFRKNFHTIPWCSHCDIFTLKQKS